MNIEMVFVAHPWSVQLFDEHIIDKAKKTVMIEVTTESILSYLCGKAGSRRPGALPFLTNPAQLDIDKLARAYPLIPAPLVLAANPKISRETLIHALLALETCDANCETIIFVVHIYHATQYQALFPLVNRFHIQWDSADYPCNELVECARVLKVTDSLSGARWGGLHVSSHWLRKTDNGDQNTQIIMDRIQQYA